jgi:phenylacetate-CoA ligase
MVETVQRFVYPFSPFYRRLFDERGLRPRHIRRLRDIEKIPLVSRSDFEPVRDDAWRPFRALLRPDESSLKRSAHRSLLRRVAVEKLLRGEESAERVLAEEFKPVHLFVRDSAGPLVGYTIRDLSAMARAPAWAMAVLGARRSDVTVSAMPFGPDLPFWLLYYAALGAGMAAFHLGSGEVVRPAQAASWMQRTAATVLATQPGYAEGLLRGAPSAAFARLRLLALWAPCGMQGARERYTLRLRAAGAADATVGALFGVPEARVAWAECPATLTDPATSHGFHTYPDLELLEVVDGDGNSLGENEPGEIVYSSLDWRGSALLRYRTGVVARRGITWERCPGCRRTVPRILPELSRVEWRARVRGARGPVALDVADVLPALWRATGIPLWQVEVVRGGGPDGADAVYANLGGALPRDAELLRRNLGPLGVEPRLVPFPELRQRMGVGLERPEVRVLVRRAVHAPASRPPELRVSPSPTPPSHGPGR